MQKHQHGGNLSLVAEQYGFRPEDFVDFSVNINPLGPPPQTAAVFECGLKYAGVYPDPDCETLKERYAQFFGITPEQLIFTNGAVELIYLAVFSLRPQTVLIPGPTFREYELAARASGARLKMFRLDPEKGFIPRLEALVRAARGVEMVFLCSPNNPTGSLLPPEILSPFLEFCDTHGIFVVVDESFLIFHNRWRELTVGKKTATNSRLLVLQSLTKFFAIPGLRIGCGIANPQVISLFKRFHPPWQVNGLAQGVAAAALNDQEYGHSTRNFVEQERSFLATALSSIPGIRVYPSEANYLLLKLAAPLSAPLVADRLARKGILVRDCSNFTFLDDSFIRVTIKDRINNQLLCRELAGLCSGLLGETV